jgi:hypothetical protein
MRLFLLLFAGLIGAGWGAAKLGAQTQQGMGKPDRGGWKAHAMDRPNPAAVEPNSHTLQAQAPANAIVLFDGTDVSQWTARDGSAAGWAARDGYLEVTPGTGDIRSRVGFGDVQLHIEWASPDPPRASGQDRGNSGVFLMGLYEVQVLDSYESRTYADGQAGAIYGQYPPRLNASSPPGEWQTYDIYFRRPRFDTDGALLEPARMTVVHNGILVQNNEELLGPTAWLRHLPYAAHADELPIELQDHGDPVRFRNIWAVPIPELPRPEPGYATRDQVIQLAPDALDRFVGAYDRPGQQAPITITREGDRLLADFYWRPGTLEMVPVSPTEFVLTETDGRVAFDLDRRGRVTGLTFHLGGAAMPARRAR